MENTRAPSANTSVRKPLSHFDEKHRTTSCDIVQNSTMSYDHDQVLKLMFEKMFELLRNRSTSRNIAKHWATPDTIDVAIPSRTIPSHTIARTNQKSHIKSHTSKVTHQKSHTKSHTSKVVHQKSQITKSHVTKSHITIFLRTCENGNKRENVWKREIDKMETKRKTGTLGN